MGPPTLHSYIIFTFMSFLIQCPSSCKCEFIFNIVLDACFHICVKINFILCYCIYVWKLLQYKSYFQRTYSKGEPRNTWFEGDSTKLATQLKSPNQISEVEALNQIGCLWIDLETYKRDKWDLTGFAYVPMHFFNQITVKV